MSRYLRSGVLWFWTLVAAAMCCVGVFALRTEPAEPTRNHPGVRELFNDAVDVRHTLATTIRNGDTVGLRTHLDTLVARWDPTGAPDHEAARSAAVATLTRMGDVAADAGTNAAWRDALAVEADLFAALAADPDDPALIALAVTGHGEPASMRPGPLPAPEFSSAEERLEAVIAEGGVTTLDELRNRLRNAGAPALPTRNTPTLNPPSPEELPR